MAVGTLDVWRYIAEESEIANIEILLTILRRTDIILTREEE